MITQHMMEDALRYIGVPKGKADEQMIRKVKAGFEALEPIKLSKVIYQRVEVEHQVDEIQLKGTLCKVQSHDLAKLLEHSKECILMAATLGIEVDRQIALKQKVNMLDAVVIDACASVLIDKLCDELEAEIISKLKEGEYLTMRFSPGYGDVPLELSDEILEILMASKRIGLTLTKTHMLLPTKSITAIIGISNQKENRQKTCGHCNLVTSCMYRRRGERCGL